MKKKIISKGSFAIISYPSSNKILFSKGIIKPYSENLIKKAKKEGLKIFTNNKGEVFIALPIYDI